MRLRLDGTIRREHRAACGEASSPRGMDTQLPHTVGRLALSRCERLAHGRKRGAEAILVRGDGGGGESLRRIELAGKLRHVFSGDTVDLLEQLVEGEKRRVEEQRLADP